jgi:flagellar FliJ protein
LKKKSERLKIVLELAVRKEKTAMDDLAKKRRYRDEQLAQLENLKQYHSQYLNDMRKSSSQVHNVVSLQANLHFLTQVDAAIQQQEGVLRIAENEFSVSMKNWLVLHQKRKGMADLIVKYKTEEMNLADKKEQQQIESDLLSRKYRG